MTIEQSSRLDDDLNTVVGHQRLLQSHFENEDGAGDIDQTGPASCLAPLLTALGWRGEERHIKEALPHFDDLNHMDDLRAVLSRLNYSSRPETKRLCDIAPYRLPCLFSENDGDVKILIARQDNKLIIFDGETKSYTEIEANKTAGTAYFIQLIDVEQNHKDNVKSGWIQNLTRKFRTVFLQILGVTFITNMFALAVPIYVMNVYDKVIGTSSVDSLGFFALGILLVMGCDFALRSVRSRIIAYLGARLDMLLASASFEQLLHLPVSMTESAPIGTQITRLKQFEGLREVFTGAVANAAFDLPFMIIFLTAIIIFGGHVAWVPISLIVIFCILACFTVPISNRHTSISGEARSKLQNFLIEMVSNQKMIRLNTAEKIWEERYQEHVAESSKTQFYAGQITNLVQTLAQSLVMIAGVATLGVGTLMVMSEDMSMGALIAVMALVWRVLSPVQSLFLSVNRITQVRQSIKMFNNLMRLKLETIPGELPSFFRQFRGGLRLNRLSFKYPSKSEPALMGINLDIKPGEFIALTGASGAGKSTLVKLISGLYEPQAGALVLDGMDMRQLSISEVRQAIGYVPQQATFFYGTIEQNIRLALPNATDEQVTRALLAAGIEESSDNLPEGRKTRLTSEFQRKMSDGLKQRLMLARAYVKNPPIFLLDEPGNNLDDMSDQQLMAQLQGLKGKSTIIMITHRPSHMKLADRVIYLDQGQVVHDGAPEQVIPLILNAA